MSNDQKLTRQMINDALGKKISSKEFIAITDILGEPEIRTDIESDITDYSWDNYGIDIVINHEDETFDNIVLYPYGSTSEFEYINDQKSCTPICKENDFEENITMQEVREKYGKPDAEGDSHRGHTLSYWDLDGYEIYFTFSDKSKLFAILIGIRSN